MNITNVGQFTWVCPFLSQKAQYPGKSLSQGNDYSVDHPVDEDISILPPGKVNSVLEYTDSGTIMK